MATPCSVNAIGRYRAPPHLEVTICDLKTVSSSLLDLKINVRKIFDSDRLLIPLNGIYNKDLPKLKQYKSYHTSIKQLARSNILPQKYTACINRSTIWRWKNENENKYIGSELSNIDLLEQFLERQESATIIRTYLKLATSFSVILRRSAQVQNILSENKEKFVHSILKYKKDVNLKFILRLCNISSSVFYHWKNQVLKKCPSSPFQLCRRIYPTQLTQDEVNRMKDMLIDQRFRYWTVNSIAYYALRNNIVNASIATWYNYINKLGWDRPRLPKKSKYETEIRMKSIKQAYEQYIMVSGKDVRLIVDGGVENNNNIVDDYISSEEVRVQKLIAGKDICFSNSMV